MLIADSGKQLQIDRPFARAAIIQQRNSAVFMDITNRGETVQLVYARSPSAKIVELHNHINDGGVMRMRRIDQIDIPSGQSVKLERGGLHVMLLDLNHDLIEGSQIELTFGFSDGSEEVLKIPIQKMKMKHGNHKARDERRMLMAH